MLELRCIKQLALCIQILKYQRICVFYEFSCIRGLCGQITLAVYELYEGQLVITSDKKPRKRRNRRKRKKEKRKKRRSLKYPRKNFLSKR